MKPQLIVKIFLAIAGTFPVTACNWLHSGQNSEPVAVSRKVPSTTADPQTAGAMDQQAKLREERDLKLAKLWARVDELEDEQYRQKERLAILEKGMTLGLVPEELRYPERTKSPKIDPKSKASPSVPPISDVVDKNRDIISVTPKQVLEAERNSPAENKFNSELAKSEGDTEPDDDEQKQEDFSSKEEKSSYQTALATAHDSYRAGRYGRAIVEYSAIGKKFGDRVGGAMHLYWVAKCWSNLKEYSTSKQLLGDFIKKHNDSPWVPRAMLELGRVEWQLGMRETALASFRSVIQKHPYADAAEMAKMELDTLDKKL